MEGRFYCIIEISIRTNAGTTKAIPDTPTNVRVTGIGARSIEVSWSHSGGGFSSNLNNGFVINVISTSELENITNEFVIANVTARSFLAEGLMPYRYFSRNGVVFQVTVFSLSGATLSKAPAPMSVTLPRKFNEQHN